MRKHLNSAKILIVLTAMFVFAVMLGKQNLPMVFSQAVQPSPTPQPAVFDQAKAIAELTAQIKGKEQEPAEKVFKNVQMLKSVPAANLLRIMEFGYARSLGVDCTHCHVAGQWEKEDNVKKQVARDMAKMVQVINGEQLKNIKNLGSANPIVNCTTCHRGQIKPALNLPAAK